MAKKEKIDYRELSQDELRQRLVEAREKLFELRFQSTTAPLKNPHLVSTTRREIARLLTVIKQKGVRV
ncbi:MAG TPA: 50S ribosomal protein L29 [Elusimicrobiota bacterium]|nr:50S ribosomal protein L29 [Elusimicrobiota bacterium]